MEKAVVEDSGVVTISRKHLGKLKTLLMEMQEITDLEIFLENWGVDGDGPQEQLEAVIGVVAEALEIVEAVYHPLPPKTGPNGKPKAPKAAPIF